MRKFDGKENAGVYAMIAVASIIYVRGLDWFYNVYCI